MKKSSSLLIFLVIFNLTFPLVQIKAQTSFSVTNAPPGSFYISKNELEPCSVYEWSFSISASKLQVRAYNSSQYSILENDRDSTDYTAILNTISYPGQSGEWSPPYKDTWYIIYRNVGSSRYNMHARHSVKIYNCYTPYIFLFGIVGLIGVIIGIIYYYVYKPRRISKSSNGSITWKDKLIK